MVSICSYIYKSYNCGIAYNWTECRNSVINFLHLFMLMLYNAVFTNNPLTHIDPGSRYRSEHVLIDLGSRYKAELVLQCIFFYIMCRIMCYARCRSITMILQRQEIGGIDRFAIWDGFTTSDINPY